MKHLDNFINEAKIENLMNPNIDIRPYVNCMLETWLKSVNSWTITSLGDGYNKIALCRKCAELVYLLDKFSDDITIHFVKADKDANKKNCYDYYSIGDRLYKAFEVITGVLESGDDVTVGEEGSLQDTIEALNKDFTALVKKYNKKYNEKLDNAKGEAVPVPVPCDCECCCGCECDC